MIDNEEFLRNRLRNTQEISAVGLSPANAAAAKARWEASGKPGSRLTQLAYEDISEEKLAASAAENPLQKAQNLIASDDIMSRLGEAVNTGNRQALIRLATASEKTVDELIQIYEDSVGVALPTPEQLMAFRERLNLLYIEAQGVAQEKKLDFVYTLENEAKQLLARFHTLSFLYLSYVSDYKQGFESRFSSKGMSEILTPLPDLVVLLGLYVELMRMQMNGYKLPDKLNNPKAIDSLLRESLLDTINLILLKNGKNLKIVEFGEMIKQTLTDRRRETTAEVTKKKYSWKKSKALRQIFVPPAPQD
jgi:hypothetical protein